MLSVQQNSNRGWKLVRFTVEVVIDQIDLLGLTVVVVVVVDAATSTVTVR